MGSNSWWYYSLTPATFGLPAGLWFDFPHMDVGTNYLYFTTNIFNTVGDTYYGAMIVRVPLSQLAAGTGVTMNCNVYPPATGMGSITTVSGMTTTAYSGSTYNANSVAVVQWPESSPTPSAPVVVSSLATTFIATFSCLGPDGRDPCIALVRACKRDG